MPSLGVTRFEMSLRCHGLRPSEKSILRCLAYGNVDLNNDFSNAVDELAAHCLLPRPQTFRLIADLAERGFIRVSGRYVQIEFYR